MADVHILKAYYRLTKPGIIYGNLITTAAGFLLASKGDIDIGLFLATLAGVGLVIGSACAFNNYIDRGIDAKMARTKQRALAAGTIKPAHALLYATLLGLLGAALLITFTNTLTVILGVIAILDYVVLYGITKRRGPYGTLVGSIAGALPPVAGYTAVTNQLDLGALLLFLLLVTWQMAHFYAIAIYRQKDYEAAGIPVLPAKQGVPRTKKSMLAYILAFMVVVMLFTAFDYTGYAFLIVTLAVSIKWLVMAFGGFRAKDNVKWARDMFGFSLVVNLTFSIMLGLNAWLP